MRPNKADSMFLIFESQVCDARWTVIDVIAELLLEAMHCCLPSAGWPRAVTCHMCQSVRVSQYVSAGLC